MQIGVYNAFSYMGRSASVNLWRRDVMNILSKEVGNFIDGVWGAVEHLIILHIYLAVVFITPWHFWEHYQVFWNREFWEYLDFFGDANEVVMWVYEVYKYIQASCISCTTRKWSRHSRNETRYSFFWLSVRSAPSR